VTEGKGREGRLQDLTFTDKSVEGCRMMGRKINQEQGIHKTPGGNHRGWGGTKAEAYSHWQAVWVRHDKVAAMKNEKNGNWCGNKRENNLARFA